MKRVPFISTPVVMTKIRAGRFLFDSQGISPLTFRLTFRIEDHGGLAPYSLTPQTPSCYCYDPIVLIHLKSFPHTDGFTIRTRERWMTIDTAFASVCEGRLGEII